MDSISGLYEKLGFEQRKGQQDYSEFILGALSEKTKYPSVFAEVETGIGRTIGYLIPTILHAASNNERIVISVFSNATRKQIWEQDIPKIQPLLEGKLRPANLKERSNYICLNRYHKCVDEQNRLTAEEKLIFIAVAPWLRKTEEGDLNEILHQSRNPVLWRKLASEPVSCLRKACPRFKECFLQKAMEKANNSNLLLVSHNFLLKDILMDFALLPSYTHVVFDEAHYLLSQTHYVFGRHLNFYSLRNFLKRNSWLESAQEKSQECEKALLKVIKNLVDGIQKSKISNRRHIYKQSLASETGVSIEPLQQALKELLEVVEQNNSKEAEQFASDIRRFSSDLAFLFSGSYKDFVYWLDINSNPYQLGFNAEPVDIAGYWRKFLSGIKSSVFVSNLAKSSNGFNSILNSLGLKENRNVQCAVFASGKENSIKVIANQSLPKPSEEKFVEEIVKLLTEELSKSTENCLIFCDYNIISKLYEELNPLFTRQGRPAFYQCIDGAFYNLLQFFQKENGSILFGLTDECRVLDNAELPEGTKIIFVRLPFPDNKEPLLSMRSEKLKEQGKNPFSNLILPKMLLTLNAAYSALVKKGGTLTILDTRIFTEPYGKQIRGAFKI